MQKKRRIVLSAPLLICLLMIAAVPVFSDDYILIEMHPLLDEYEARNAEETRLAEYADDRDTLNLKLLQLDYINESRRKAGSPPVDLDILACRVANRMAREAVAENFTGHWNTRGEKPYHRWAFAGGVDHVSENAAAKWSSAPLPGGLGNLLSNMREAHDAFMSERPPNDGHRQNCIDPVHTHVGLGVAQEGKQFRYYEEFIDRYIEFADVPAAVSAGESFDIRVRPMDEAYNIYALIGYYEPFPGPVSAQTISRRGAYPDYTNSQVLALWPWDLIPHLDTETRWSAIPLKFDRSGLYYIHMYLHPGDLPTSGRVSTRGKIQASGLVIRVD